jgi:hypothetical protein
MSACRGCGKEIVWAETNHGKKIPLDAKIAVYSVKNERGTLIALNITGHTGPNGDHYMVSHFNTCSKADHFSGSSRRITDAKPPAPDRHYSEPKEPEGYENA